MLLNWWIQCFFAIEREKSHGNMSLIENKKVARQRGRKKGKIVELFNLISIEQSERSVFLFAFLFSFLLSSVVIMTKPRINSNKLVKACYTRANMQFVATKKISSCLHMRRKELNQKNEKGELIMMCACFDCELNIIFFISIFRCIYTMNG